MVRKWNIETDIVVAGEAEIREKKEVGTVVDISIHQGRKHQVKKMFLAVGHPVV